MLRSLLALSIAAVASSAPVPDFCVSDSKGWVTALATPCPPSTTALRGVGVNLFDIFWGAWGTGGENATLATAKAALRDAAMSGYAFARTFASPFSYREWAWFDPATRPAYWAAAAEVVAEAEHCGIKLIPSLSYGCADSTVPCNPAVALFNETYREFITNASSLTRAALRAYHQDFVARFKGSSAVLMWELGNEMNLAMDGCTYDKSPGAYFTTAEGLAYQREAAADIKAIDPERPVGSGMGSPRSRAKHLMNTPGGAGAVCVTPENPKGDCELCFGLPADSQQDYADMLALYYSSQDLVSAHYYGCNAPYGNLSWCSDPASTAPLGMFRAAAEALGKPLFVGEFGPGDGLWAGSSSPGRAILAGMAEQGVPLSSLWAFECPSHDATNQPGFCLHPGRPAAQPFSEQVNDMARTVNRQLQAPPQPPAQSNMTLVWLPPPTGQPGEPACLDGSGYGYYALPGKVNKWVVMLQGGGWCPRLEDCFQRTLPDYAGGNLGSSKNWADWTWKFDLGADFADWGALFLP